METTVVTAIIAHGILGEKGFRQVALDDYDWEFRFYVHPNSVKYIANVQQVPTNQRTLKGKNDYFYQRAGKRILENSTYGGSLEDAVVWVNHPYENRIIKEMESLAEEFKSIAVPKGFSNVKSELWDKTSYAPLDKWGSNFVKRFSKYFKNGYYRPTEEFLKKMAKEIASK
jgi:hypothetical protein